MQIEKLTSSFVISSRTIISGFSLSVDLITSTTSGIMELNTILFDHNKKYKVKEAILS